MQLCVPDDGCTVVFAEPATPSGVGNPGFSFHVNGLPIGPSVKSQGTNSIHSFWNCNCLDGDTIEKSTGPDGGNLWGDGELAQGRAVPESLLRNLSHRIRKSGLFQAGTIGKDRCAHGCYGIGDCDLCQIFTAVEADISNGSDGGRNDDSGQTGAAAKAAFSEDGNGIWDGYSGNIGT